MRARLSHSTQVFGALAVSAASLAVRQALDPLLEHLEPFATGFLAVAASVWFLGWQAGITTALTVYFGAHYLFVEPRQGWTMQARNNPRGRGACFTISLPAARSG